MGDRKLLAMDLDGTILDSNGQLHEQSIRALNILREKGHVVSYATGRREYDMVNFQYLYDCTDYVILNTGSIIDQTSMFSFTMSCRCFFFLTAGPAGLVISAIRTPPQHGYRASFLFTNAIVS